MAKSNPSAVFALVFDTLVDHSFQHADELVDAALTDLAQDIYEQSKAFGFDPEIASDALDALGVER